MKLNTFEDKLRRKTWGIVLLGAVYGFLTALVMVGVLLYAVLILGYFWPHLFSFSVPAPLLIGFGLGVPCAAALITGYLERRDAKGLTRKIEQHYPHLRDRLHTLVEISGNRRQIERDPVSRVFAKSLEADMSALIDRFNFGRVFSPRRLLVPAIFLMVCVLTGTVHAMMHPEFFAMGFGRLIRSNQKMPPPVREAPPFNIQVVPGDTQIVRGSNLLVEVTTPGYNFKQGDIYFKNNDETAWRIHSGKALSGDRFQVLLQHVVSPGSYRAVVDGNPSPVFQVKFYESLRAERVRWMLTFPSYMKLKEHNRQGWNGKITVPRGTKVRVEFSFNQPVQQGWLLERGKQRFPLALKSSRVLEANFIAEEDLKLTPQVESESGGMKLEAPEVWIQTLPDLAPYLEIMEPQIHNYVFPTQEIPFEINANDDYGIRSVTLVIRYKGKEERIEWFHSDKAQDTVELKPILKLEAFKLQSRDLIFAYLEVQDNYPGNDPDHVVRSPLISFLTRDYVEQYKIQSPKNEKPSIRQQFEEVLADQEKIMSDTWDYITMPPKDQPVGWDADGNSEQS